MLICRPEDGFNMEDMTICRPECPLSGGSLSFRLMTHGHHTLVSSYVIPGQDCQRQVPPPRQLMFRCHLCFYITPWIVDWFSTGAFFLSVMSPFHDVSWPRVWVSAHILWCLVLLCSRLPLQHPFLPTFLPPTTPFLTSYNPFAYLLQPPCLPPTTPLHTSYKPLSYLLQPSFLPPTTPFLTPFLTPYNPLSYILQPPFLHPTTPFLTSYNPLSYILQPPFLHPTTPFLSSYNPLSYLLQPPFLPPTTPFLTSYNPLSYLLHHSLDLVISETITDAVTVTDSQTCAR